MRLRIRGLSVDMHVNGSEFLAGFWAHMFDIVKKFLRKKRPTNLPANQPSNQSHVLQSIIHVLRWREYTMEDLQEDGQRTRVRARKRLDEKSCTARTRRESGINKEGEAMMTCFDLLPHSFLFHYSYRPSLGPISISASCPRFSFMSAWVLFFSMSDS